MSHTVQHLYVIELHCHQKKNVGELKYHCTEAQPLCTFSRQLACFLGGP